MKRVITFLTVFLFFLLTHCSFSQILLDENFNYPAGDSLTAHGWVRHSGSQGQPLVVSPGLTFTGYPLSGIGNAARLDTVGVSGIDVNKGFTPDSSNNVYVAFMVKVLYATPTGDYFFHINQDVIGTTFRAKVFAKDSSGVLKFGLTKAANTGVYASGIYLYNFTYLLVVKYRFLTGSTTDDDVSLYIFNTTIPGAEPGTPDVGPLAEVISDLTNAGTIALRQGVNTQRPILIIDGMRVFKSWNNIISGLMPISSVADRFSLKQNYPNPFNPSTKIQFAIPAGKRHAFSVQLKIYDALGREVSRLINEQLNPGTYEIDFNAVDYPSGIYYYKLIADEFTDSKKMILVK